MKTLEKGQDKVTKICAILRDETLEPAQKEAQQIIENAKEQAEEILAQAKKSADKLHQNAKVLIEQENRVFQAALEQASKQALEILRQSIEEKFFNEHLLALVEKDAADPNQIADLINAIVKALEKDGLSANLTALVAKTMVPRKINELLLQEVVKSLNDQSVAIGNFNSGVKLRVNNKKMTLDLSENALKELLSTYVVRKDFRKMIFNNPS